MRKQKQKDPSAAKRQAFMSFLQTSSTPKQQTTKKNNSDHQQVYEEQYTEKSNNCNVCGMEVSDNIRNKRTCGFCDLVACKEHLRKRRRKKNKWEKICDECEDRFLYDSYMKLEKKKEESLMVQEEIITMKHANLSESLQNLQSNKAELLEFQSKLKTKHEEAIEKIKQQQNQLQQARSQLENQRLVCQELQEENDRKSKKIKENYQQDYLVLQKQNERIRGELGRAEKRCREIETIMKKRQKQIYAAYQQWQSREQRKSVIMQQNKKKEQEKCRVF